MSRINSTGRRRTGPPFVQLFNYMLDCPAWRSLKLSDRAVLIELARKYNGMNNGWLGLGVREAAERCGINKDTASRSFHRLRERGFIDCTQEGSFSFKERHTAEWRLTWHRCDRTRTPPSKAFLKWKPASSADFESRSEKRATRVPIGGTDPPKPFASVPSTRTVGPAAAR